MKANELMIGDWVKTKECRCRVDKLFKEKMNITCTWTDFLYTDVEPIPLTEEILKANGWKRRGRFFINSAYDSKFSTILNYENNTTIFSIFIKGIDLKYVHELQHALRLCGLNELADNFKLKAMEE